MSTCLSDCTNQEVGFELWPFSPIGPSLTSQSEYLRWDDGTIENFRTRVGLEPGSIDSCTNAPPIGIKLQYITEHLEKYTYRMTGTF
jgi:hypothetical protein